MKIGVAQYNIVWENKTENMRRCEDFFAEAAECGCDLLVFPELSLIGFTMNTTLAEQSAYGDTSVFFSDCCKKYGVSAVFGYAEKCEDKHWNKLALCDKNGIITAEYAKLHPFRNGGEIYCCGDSCVIADIGGAKLGLSICYDLRFPEVYQQLSKTAEIIVVSANWAEARRMHWITLLKARAIENQCFVVGCNMVGEAGGISYSGDSMIVAPDGEVIACAGQGKEQLMCCEIDIGIIQSLRESFPLKHDRRNEIYRNFMNKVGI